MRAKSTYRAARRNAAIHTKPKSVWFGCMVLLHKGEPIVRYAPVQNHSKGPYGGYSDRRPPA